MQSQLNAMDNKVDEALRACEPQQDVSTVKPDTTPQPDVTEVSISKVLHRAVRVIVLNINQSQVVIGAEFSLLVVLLV